MHRLATTVLAALPLTLAAQGRGIEGLPGRWRLAGGGFHVGADATIRLDALDGRLGTEIDLERDLGFDVGATSAFAELTWEPSWVHRVSLSYYDVDRGSRRRLAAPLTWEGTTYQANVEVAAGFRTQFITLGYQYTLWRNRWIQFGPGIAIPVLRASGFISGEAAVSDGSGGQLGSRFRREDTEATLPVPIPGMHLTARLAPRVYLDGRAQLIYVDAFDIKGVASDFHLRAHWFPRPWLGVGMGGVRNRLRVEGGDPRRLNGKVDYLFNGGTLSVTLAR